MTLFVPAMAVAAARGWPSLQVEIVDGQRLDPVELDLELTGGIRIVAAADDRVAAGGEVADLTGTGQGGRVDPRNA